MKSKLYDKTSKRKNNFIFVVVLALGLGCAGVQRRVDDICEHVSNADVTAAILLETALYDPDISDTDKERLIREAERLQLAYDACFVDPQGGAL